VALLLATPTAVVACLWDNDSLRMERSRFPDTLELITGKFLRHSPEFYEWRVADRLKRLGADPSNVALRDDLAVAYDKLGRHDAAIATALETERLQPNRYKTAANLGTFLIHAGKLQEGLPHLERALALNPDAHFGREKYQKLLVEYVLATRKNAPGKLPLAYVDATSPDSAIVSNTFATYATGGKGWSFSPAEAAAAVKGVLGMMRFGQYDSPILLEALGTLLAQDGTNPTVDAKALACRAFLKASYAVPDGPQRANYRAMAVRVLMMQTDGRSGLKTVPLGQVESEFRAELADAEAWYAALHERELAWIRDGKNPEAEFDKLYAADPQVAAVEEPAPRFTISQQDTILAATLLIAGLVILLFALIGLAVVVRRLLTGRWWGSRAEAGV
jgi:tetratricopeptide (TPR) repeat protein